MNKKIKNTFTIGTRGSRLALLQVTEVTRELKARFPEVEISTTIIKTTGDTVLDTPLARIGGKGLFVKEIEDALLNGTVDLVVHSMKDVPTDVREGLLIAGITRRRDSRDALITKGNKKLHELPGGARIGTSSPRRRAQILHVRPDVVIVELRGNVETRLKKLEKNNLEAIIVALAGLERMALQQQVTEILPFETCLPAVGQGALGIEIRADDTDMRRYAAVLDHPETRRAITAERAFLKKLQGGCQVPVGAYGHIDKGLLSLEGMVASLDGKTLLRDSITGESARAENLGIQLAERLLERGADEILTHIR